MLRKNEYYGVAEPLIRWGENNYKKIVNLIELAVLFDRHKKSYIDYFLNKKRRIYTYLKENGCKHIKAVQHLEWKVWFGSYYFRAMLNGEKYL